MASPISPVSIYRNRRRFLVGAAAMGVGGAAIVPVQRLFSRSSDEAISLPMFRRNGDLDDTASLFRAAERGLPIHAPAGGGSGPAGRYLVATTAADLLPSGFQLFGDGIEKTIFSRSYARSAPFILHADSGSADARENLTGIHLRDLTFEDDVVGRGFSQFNYLVMLSGVSGAVIERVAFRGFRGDGLYIGSSTIRAHERHNRNVLVTDCVFDGVNANNRNAISVLDCDGLVIERSRFLNTTRNGDGGVSEADPMNPLTGAPMPGAIDFEPDEPFAIIRNITVRDNHFSGGGGFAVALTLLSNMYVRVPIRGFTITGNTIEGRHGGFSANGFAGDEALTSDRSYDVEITNNSVSGCVKPFILHGMRGLTLTSNRFTDCEEAAELGYTTASADVTLEDNSFTRIGYARAGYGLWVRSVRGLKMVDNRFVDCGLATGKFGIALAFVKGDMRDIELTANSFSAPAGRTKEAVSVFREAHLNRSTVRASRNRVRLPSAPDAPTLGL